MLRSCPLLILSSIFLAAFAGADRLSVNRSQLASAGNDDALVFAGGYGACGANGTSGDCDAVDIFKLSTMTWSTSKVTD
jgi:hypothetical protein